MTQKKNKMESMPIPRLVMSISLPLMISLLVQSLYNIVDGIYVARVSEAALTATSLAYPMQMLMIAVSVGTGVGVNSLLSRSIGAKDEDAVAATTMNGLFLAVVSCLVFMCIGFFGVPLFFSFFTKEAALVQMGVEYLRVCLIFSLGIFLATTAERLLQATGNTMLSMMAQVAGAVTNVVLDPILIFGWFGLPAMGVKGAAVATVAGQWLAAGLALWLNHKKNKTIQFVFKGFRPRADIIGEIYKVGVPSMMVSALGSIMMVLMNRMLLTFSATAVAFYGVYYKLQNFLFMPVNGLSQGLIPIVGYNYGAKRGRQISEAFKVAAAIAVGIMGVGTLIFNLFPRQLLALFNAGGDMLSIGVPALRIISLTFMLTGVVLVIGHVFTGMGNGVVNMVSTIVRYILPLPCIYFIATRFGLGASWVSFCIADACAFIISVVMYIRVRRKVIKCLDAQEKQPQH